MAAPSSQHERPHVLAPCIVLSDGMNGLRLCRAVLSHAMLFHIVPCHAMLCYAMLCYAMLCYAMLCYAMLCYAMHHVVLYDGLSKHACSLVLPYAVMQRTLQGCLQKALDAALFSRTHAKWETLQRAEPLWHPGHTSCMTA